MSFPSDDNNSLAMIIINDNYGLTSTLYDAQHLSLICYLLGFKQIIVVSNDPNTKILFGTLELISLDQALSTYIKNGMDILIVMSMDINVGREYVADIKEHTTGVNSRILILLDMCQSGGYMSLPYTTTSHVAITKIIDTLGIVTISPVNSYEFDSDNISELGFGGGLSDSFIDYLLGPTNYEPNEILSKLTDGSFRPINDKISVIEFFNQLLLDSVGTHPMMSSNIENGWYIFE
jgi:hypothetical protein